MVLLNNLLDFSKLEAGKMEYRMIAVDINSLAREIVTDFKTELESQRVEIEIAPPDFIPVAWCDPYKITQVFENLLSNSLKYSRDDNHITISFTRSQDNEMARVVPKILVKLTDKGIGIPRDEVDDIFDTFSQSSRTKNGAGGTGLGLSICRKIIEDHHGKIWAESESQVGTTIYFTLPERSNAIDVPDS